VKRYGAPTSPCGVAGTAPSFVIVAGTFVAVGFMVAAVLGAVGGTVVAVGCVVVIAGSTTAVLRSVVVVPTEATPAVSPAFLPISRPSYPIH